MSAITVTPALVRHIPTLGMLPDNYTAGEALTIGDVVYEATTGYVLKADSDAGTPKENGIGIVIESFDGETSIASGAICAVLQMGYVTGFTGGVKGALGYVSETAGAIDTVPGNFNRILGRWVTAETFFVFPMLSDSASQ